MREEKRALILLLLYCLFYSVSTNSFCDEVDSVFIFDTDLIMNHPSHGAKIEEFIETVIYEASSEESGVGFIVYGNLPITLQSDSMDDIIFLGLEETKFHSTIQTQEIINNNLDFSDFFNDDLMNGADGANIAMFEFALQSAHNLFIHESTVKNDVIFIIDTDHNVKSKCIEYASNQNSNDIEEIYFVEIVFNGDGDIELDHVFDCKHNGKESEKYDALNKLYDITCPCLMQFDESNYAKCNRKDQWIDPDSVISCNIDSIHHPITHRLIILPSSTMIINDTINDLMSFEKDYILLTQSKHLDIMKEKGCYIPAFKIIKMERIDDDNNTFKLFKLNIIAVGIFDYISEGHMKYHQDPPRSTRNAATSSTKRRRMLSVNPNTGNITFREEFELTASISRGKWSLTGTGELTVTGWAYFGVLFGIDFELDIKWCVFIPCGLDNFLFAVYGGIDIDFVLNTEFKGSLEISYDMIEIDGSTISFYIWFIPVWFAPRLEMSQFLTLEASYTKLTHQFAIHFHPFYKLGVQFDGSDWISINEYSESNSYTNKFLIGDSDNSLYPGCPSGVITTGIELKLGGTLYSTVFIYLSLTPALKAVVALPSSCGGGEVCTSNYVPNYVEINPSLVISMGVGFVILDNVITKLVGAAGLGYDFTIIDEAVIVNFDQICIGNEVSLPIQGCCEYASSVTTEESGSIRLADGNTTWEGRVEIVDGGYWKTVCNNNVNNDVGKVICGELGFETEGFTLYKQDGNSPYGPGVAFIAFEVNCDGDESRLYDCNKNYNQNCDHSEDLAIKCIPPPAGTLSLTGSGSTESQGRIEIFDGTEWGTICNSGSSDSNNHIGMVICRQQGLYGHFYTLYTSTTPYGQGKGSIVMDDVVCHGAEENLLKCRYDSTPNCIHSKDLSIKCHVAPTGYIRLTGDTSTDYKGAIEIADGSEWRGVCNDDFDSSAPIGATICRQLGHSTTGYTITSITDWISTIRAYAWCWYFNWLNLIQGPAVIEISKTFGNGDSITFSYSFGHKMIIFNGVARAPSVFFQFIEEQQSLIADVNCIGDEYRLEHCGHSYRDYCPYSESVMNLPLWDLADYVDNEPLSQLWIECIPSQGAVRLNGIGSTKYEGRVEVYIGNEWGTICNDLVDVNVGRVICKMLDYSTDGFQIFGKTNYDTPYGEGSGAILMDNIQCIGTEASLIECQYTSNHNCGHHQDLSIKCYNPKEGDIRLSEGGALNEGRIEIFIGSEWGTVCNDGIDDDTNPIGKVICNQLGYLEDDYILYNKQPQQGQLPYGEGTTPILMDNVVCNGDESKLIDCTFSEGNDCGHHEDLAIKCFYPGYDSYDEQDGKSWYVALTLGDNDEYDIDIGQDKFNQLFSISGVIKRECDQCSDDMKIVYYRRIYPYDDLSTFDAYNMMKKWQDSDDNILNINYILTNDVNTAVSNDYDYDALNSNYWQYCNYNNFPDIPKIYKFGFRTGGGQYDGSGQVTLTLIYESEIYKCTISGSQGGYNQYFCYGYESLVDVNCINHNQILIETPSGSGDALIIDRIYVDPPENYNMVTFTTSICVTGDNDCGPDRDTNHVLMDLSGSITDADLDYDSELNPIDCHVGKIKSFGIKTVNAESAGSAEAKLTLIYESEAYECTIYPASKDTTYLCDASLSFIDTYTDCTGNNQIMIENLPATTDNALEVNTIYIIPQQGNTITLSIDPIICLAATDDGSLWANHVTINIDSSNDIYYGTQLNVESLCAFNPDGSNSAKLYKFGFRTINHIYGGSAEAKLTLIYESEAYECTIYPTNGNTEYYCYGSITLVDTNCRENNQMLIENLPLTTGDALKIDRIYIDPPGNFNMMTFTTSICLAADGDCPTLTNHVIVDISDNSNDPNLDYDSKLNIYSDCRVGAFGQCASNYGANDGLQMYCDPDISSSCKSVKFSILLYHAFVPPISADSENNCDVMAAASIPSYDINVKPQLPHQPLSLVWIIIGGLLIMLLLFNIYLICHRMRGKKKNGYLSVKRIDSEYSDYSDSENNT